MPELPEVETTLRAIKKFQGQHLKKIKVHNRNLRWKVDKNLEKISENQKLVSLNRRAKYIIFKLEKVFLILHLGMSGSLRISRNDHNYFVKHDHIEFIFESEKIIFNDPRRFGSLHFTKEFNTHKLIADAKAPLDPFDEYFDAPEKGDYETIKLIKTKIGKAIKDHIDELSKKHYHKAKGSFKFILMFLPSENHVQIARESSKYMQIDLENYARGKNILITGPRNFLIDLDWFDKLMSMEENNKLANELLDTINPLFSASKVLFSHFVDHSRSINQVVKSAEKINSSFSKTLINALQKVKDKGYKNPDIETTIENSEKLSESGLDQVSEPQDNLYKLDITKKKKD